MKEFVEKYRTVRQRTVWGETTKDKAGALPPAVYTKQQDLNKVDLISSVAPLKSLYFHWTAICSSSILFTPRSLFLLFVLLFSGLIVEDLTTAATSPDLVVGLENDFNTEDPAVSTRQEEEECVQSPRGGGATQLSFIRGGSARRFKPLPFNILIFTEKVPLSYTSRMSQNNRISCNRHVFPGYSVILIQLRSYFCQNVAPFDILRLGHHFFHFAADFVTLSYTKIAMFPTLLYTVSLKKARLAGGASPYSLL